MHMAAPLTLDHALKRCLPREELAHAGGCRIPEWTGDAVAVQTPVDEDYRVPRFGKRRRQLRSIQADIDAFVLGDEQRAKAAVTRGAIMQVSGKL